ncbi:MAG: hypothetical protein JWN50_204 [Parcubacteria group bacterium]|nr:hypothetical protein [Parcubacteria group bacterium]
MTEPKSEFHELFEDAKSLFIHHDPTKEQILEMIGRLVERVKTSEDLRRLRFAVDWKQVQHAKAEINERFEPAFARLDKKFEKAAERAAEDTAQE